MAELDRVGQQVEHDLVEGALVGDRSPAARRCKLHDELDAGLARLQRQDLAAVGDHLLGREPLGRDLEIAGLDLRHVENAVDDRQEMMAGAVDQVGIFLPPLGADHQRALLHQHFGEADDGVERRAQFVAHGREEAALCGVRPFGFRARLFEHLLLHLALGGVAHDRDDLAVVAVAAFARAWSSGRQRISTQMNCPAGCAPASSGIAPHTELDRAGLAQRGSVGKRREIGRPVGDMHPIEQAVAQEVLRPSRRTAARPPATRTARRRCGHGG